MVDLHAFHDYIHNKEIKYFLTNILNIFLEYIQLAKFSEN